MGQYLRHVFVCTIGKTCGAAGAQEVFDALKRGVAAAGLKGIVRINRAGCMQQCGHGPMAVVYPEGVWYDGLDVRKATRILEEHLVGGVPVEELRYIAPPGDNKLVDEE